MWIAIAIVVYLSLLFGISLRTGRRGGNADFFVGGRRSRWWAVAFGMLGASISGVTFVSVPGWVSSTQFTYMQMVLGFIPGYLFVAYVLLPVYYRYNLTSIYGYLEQCFGLYGKRTAAFFFIVSKVLSSAVKLYVVIRVLDLLLFRALGVPFWLVTLVCILIIWLYTYRGGIRTIVWTDFLQTFLLLLALALLIAQVLDLLSTDCLGAIGMIGESDLSRMFLFDDFASRQNFFKQFVSGAFVVVVMTGLDQDMMQKNLSCRTLREARRNMLSYGMLFVPVNLLFLSLGALLVIYYTKGGADLPASGDALLPYFVSQMGNLPMVCFVIGMLASSFSSLDSAMTSVTTSVTVDLLNLGDNATHKTRTRIHIAVALVSCALVVWLDRYGSGHAIDVIYTLVSYLYGPLLGLFAFALLVKNRTVAGRLLPMIAILAPFVSWGVSVALWRWFDYSMGYELLLLNGLLVFTALFLTSSRKSA